MHRQKVATLAGRGALAASAELEKTARILKAPVAKALLGKGALPDEHPHTTGGIGILGTLPSQDALANCEALLIVGSSFPYIEYYPQPGSARGIQIDCDPQRIGLRYPVEAGLVGDAATVLRALNKLLRQNASGDFLARAQAGMRDWRVMMKQAEDAAETVIASDSGQTTELAARHIDLVADQAFSVSGSLASMACGVPYAIAAGIAFPGRPVAAIVGDGGLAMQLGELSTAVRYRIPLKVLVIKNNMLNQIAWEQMMFLGHPQFGCELPPIDFAKAAEAVGAKGFAVSRAEDADAILDQAFACEGVVVVEATVDAYEPMMPPRMPPDYRKNFLKSLADTPGREEIEANIAREPAATMFEGAK